MKVIGKDRTSCDVCNPIDEILARLDALERRASAIVAKVQGIAPDGEGNVTLPTSSSDTDPLHGRIDAFAMSSEVKEAADDAHAYAASIAGDVVVLQSDVELLTKEVEALDPASVVALEQSVAALQQTVNQLSNLVGGFSAVIRDLEDQMPNKVDRTGDTMTGPLNVIDTVTGSRNVQAVNGNRLQNDLDNYPFMVRTVGTYDRISGLKAFDQLSAIGIWSNKFSNNIETTSTWVKVYESKTNVTNQSLVLLVTPAKLPLNTNEFGILFVGGSFNAPRCRWMIAGSGVIKENFVAVGTNNNTIEIWVKNVSGNQGISFMKLNETNWGNLSNNWSATHVVDDTFNPSTYPYHEVSQ